MKEHTTYLRHWELRPDEISYLEVVWQQRGGSDGIGRALPAATLPSDDFSLEAAEEDRFRFFLRKSLLT